MLKQKYWLYIPAVSLDVVDLNHPPLAIIPTVDMLTSQPRPKREMEGQQWFYDGTRPRGGAEARDANSSASLPILMMAVYAMVHPPSWPRLSSTQKNQDRGGDTNGHVAVNPDKMAAVYRIRCSQSMMHDPSTLRFSEAFPTLLSYFRLPRRVTGQQEPPGISENSASFWKLARIEKLIVRSGKPELKGGGVLGIGDFALRCAGNAVANICAKSLVKLRLRTFLLVTGMLRDILFKEIIDAMEYPLLGNKALHDFVYLKASHRTVYGIWPSAPIHRQHTDRMSMSVMAVHTAISYELCLGCIPYTRPSTAINTVLLKLSTVRLRYPYDGTCTTVLYGDVRMTDENNIALSPLICWISYSLVPGITVT
ncbi:hypothetical protein ARMSODRAFT_1061452 [Armillaria solidipes]|uniref:Uncharacterized protein n=1 Tax=Armillaria solidipes TaxID=1076256 RepID=A0A2H3AY66_9AGAR|nr:hypothetical protein ARMSODRAFT_1061452 [Armillaria solidipes]